MKATRKSPSFLPPGAALFVKKRKAVPHAFVLDAIETGSPGTLLPRTRPMFGYLAVYLGEKIVLILRDKNDHHVDNGVWLATSIEHHASLRREFPHMRSIRVLGAKTTGWQLLPVDAPDFEEASLRICDLILAGDPRIGKVPARKRRAAAKPKSVLASKPSPRPKSKSPVRD